MTGDDEGLWAGFLDPPQAARPRVWWHWMNGNVDEAGITLDLEWMKRIGLGGAQTFEGGMNAPQLVPERIVFGSPEWESALRFAAETADALGLELTVATSAGWSAAGAPWVEPVDAMKKIVWSELVVPGGRVDARLPELPSVAGRYQDVPRWGSPASDPSLSRDTITVAIPETSPILIPSSARSTAGPVDATLLIDGTFATGIELPRNLAASSSEWIEYDFERPISVGHVTIGLPGPRGFGTPRPVHATLEFSTDARSWTPLAELPASQSPVRSRSFSPVTARWFRARFDGLAAADSIPSMDEGVLPLPLPTPAPITCVSQFALRGGGRVSAAEEKAGFGTTIDYYALEAPEGFGVAREDVIDVTDRVVDGHLGWDAPPGTWRVIRFGYSLTGHQNGPAPVEATGLEVDKLDARRVEAYIRRWLASIEHAAGAGLIGPRGIRSLLSDSIESGPQNWTETLFEEFERRRGYSLTEWMPALAGYLVESSDHTDRVLWDFRQTIAELAADAYYGTVSRVAHEYGLTYYAEALEDHRPQLGDDMRMRSHADIPMGAMWTFSEQEGPAATYVADLRGASSVAHVYDKEFTGAESLSAFGHPYVYAPSRLKPIADLELALGVTRFCIHTSPHQPSSVRAPGISLSPYLGQTFTRNETWAEQAGPWIEYLARSSFLLNSGTPVVDVAYFFGEEGPLTAVFGDRQPDDVPPGHAWDFVSADALASAISVDVDGQLTSRGGAAYRVLYLGGTSSRMTLTTLRRIAELVASGATVVGRPPLASPSAADSVSDFDREVRALWSSPRVRSDPLAEVLDDPDWIAPGLDVVHRRLTDADIYFVRNPSSEAVQVTVSLRTDRSGAELWDPVALTRTTARAREEGGRAVVDLSLPAYGTTFVVLGPARETASLGPREELATITPAAVALVDDPAFSGTALWTVELVVDAGWFTGHRLFLALDGVHDLAELRVNGRPSGIVWTAPFELDVTNRLVPGANEIEIAVTNTWANRLIADSGRSDSSTQLTGPVYSPDAPLRPWGLRGPVRLVRRSMQLESSAVM